MSDSVRPHRQQPTSLPRPWDSPGKNTGVGCYFLPQSQYKCVQTSCIYFLSLLNIRWFIFVLSLLVVCISSSNFFMYHESESEVAQSYPTLCDPMDCSLPGFSIHGIYQQEYWNGLPFSSPGDLPDSGIELRSPTLQVDSMPAEPPGKPL